MVLVNGGYLHCIDIKDKKKKKKFADFLTNLWAWTWSAINDTVNQDQTASNIYCDRTGVIIYDPWIEGLHFQHRDIYVKTDVEIARFGFVIL